MSTAPADHPSGLRGATRSARRRLRAFVVLHRRWLVAVCVALAVLTGLRAVAPPPEPTTPVVVAAVDLPGGRALTADDLAVRRVPEDVPPAGSVADPGSLTGQRLAAPVRAGEVITDRRVLGAGLLQAHPGSVAVPVRVPDAEVRDLLRVGDLVDLVAASRQGPATVVADAAPVLVLPRPAAGATGPGGTSGALVVVAVPESEAVDVTRASAAGMIGVVLLP